MKELGSKFYSESQFRATGRTAIFESNLRKELLKADSPYRQYDLFLSHSSQDKSIVTGFKAHLEALDLSVYVDWIEDSDARREEIADRLKVAMANSRTLLYLHTHNSRRSVWTPWEIGYFDAERGADRIGVFPLLDENRFIAPYTGHEYLLTYTQVGSDKLFEYVGAA